MRTKKYFKVLSVVLAFAILVWSGGVGMVSAKMIQDKKYINVQELLKPTEQVKSKGYIIVTKSNSALSKVEKQKKVRGLRCDRSKDYMAFAEVINEEERGELLESGNVVAIEEDAVLRGNSLETVEKEDSLETPEWNMEMIRAAKVEDEEKGEVKVAVLDSGIDVNLDINVCQRINLVPGEENISPTIEDFLGHGTSVAGIIGAKGKENEEIVGVNPGVSIYSAKVLDNNNCAPVSRVIEGIYWAIDNNVDIINMSFGMQNDSIALHNAIKEAYNNGIVMVAPAGNGENVEYPAAYSEVIAVSSVDSKGNVVNPIDSSLIDVAAPGKLIKSSGAFGGSMVSSGTSMAAPHVTGIVSKLLQKDSTVSPAFIKELLRVTANKNTEQIGVGQGIVDCYYAVNNYEKFKGNYSGDETFSQYENKREVVVEDVDYVEGRWSLEEHYTLAGNSNLYVISQNEIQLIKVGAVLPDIFLKATVDKANKPFHGFDNYVAYGCFLQEMSWRGISATNPADYWKKDDPEYNGCNYVRSEVRKLVDSQELVTFLKDAGNHHYNGVYNFDLTYMNPLTEADKKWLTLGIALHSAEDSFAHNSCYNNNGKWVLLTGDTADKPDLYSNRLIGAAQVSRKMIMKCAQIEPMTYADYALTSSYYDGSYKMRNLYAFSVKCNNGKILESPYKERISAMSITYK